jgi:hypothetical protein
MGEAIESIVGHYVRLKDRGALERLRQHRIKLWQDYRMNSVSQGFQMPSLETSLQEDMTAIDHALSCLSSSAAGVSSV